MDILEDQTRELQTARSTTSAHPTTTVISEYSSNADTIRQSFNQDIDMET